MQVRALCLNPTLTGQYSVYTGTEGRVDLGGWFFVPRWLLTFLLVQLVYHLLYVMDSIRLHELLAYFAAFCVCVCLSVCLSLCSFVSVYLCGE